jgi:catechol 2,3-dioxygenase-like lactoylglutathione lyase family enzyme
VFDHVTIRCSDGEASRRFYETVLPVIGIERTHADEHFTEWDDLSLAEAHGESRVTRGLHIGFVAPSREHVDEFWRVGTEAGYSDDGKPGLRPLYREDYYGSFLLDPDGNSMEAVHHGSLRQDGVIDHLWFRVNDVAVSKQFYELVAPHAGFELRHDSRYRAQFVGGSGGSFSVVFGTRTEYFHMAFCVDENAAVESFHREVTEAGYQDNGPPGERPMYHAGYYGAYVLDPDGNNVELVSHNR